MNERVKREKSTSAKIIPAFGQPLTSEEKRILVDGGARVPMPGLAGHLEKVLCTPVSEVDWINSGSLGHRPLILRCARDRYHG